MDPRQIIIRSLEPGDLSVLHAFVEEQFGGEPIVTPADVYWLEQLSCLKAVLRNETAGFVCYHCNGDMCEIVVLGSLVEGKGVGTALVSMILAKAREHRCTHLRIYTTNDNENALRFYQRRGFAIVATHRDVLTRVRGYKPLLPALGNNSIPLRDIIELEMAVPLTDSLA